jgi:hypothetical protein
MSIKRFEVGRKYKYEIPSWCCYSKSSAGDCGFKTDDADEYCYYFIVESRTSRTIRINQYLSGKWKRKTFYSSLIDNSESFYPFGVFCCCLNEDAYKQFVVSA